MYESHPIADVFPMLQQDELKRLSDDIAARGLLEPVVLLDNMILDGRNRYAACKLAGVAPNFVTFSGDDALGYVISKNLHRRHLSESQRAVVASKIANMQPHRPNKSANLPTYEEVSQEDAAHLMNVSPRSIRSVKAIERDAPELIPQIERGEISVNKARKIANKTTAHRAREYIPNAETSLQIIHGNMMNIVPTLGKFDCIVADPPYNVTDHEWDKIGDNFMDCVVDWLLTCKEVLSEKYHMFWFCSPKYAADTELALRDLSLPIQSRIVWHRRNMSKGSDAKSRFIDTWEMIYHIGNCDLNFPSAWDESRFDVQTFAVPQTNFKDQKLHPTQKPIGLIRRLVEYGSFDGWRVLDPFAGSGTTGEACMGLRDCVLVEQEKEYIDVINSRLSI